MDSPIPAFDYQRELASYRDEITDAMSRVIDSNQLILGPEVAAFENEFATAMGCEFSVGVASGTDALSLALTSVGVGQDDLVVTVANTAVPTVAAIRAIGARPVFVDIDASTLQMCPQNLEQLIRDAKQPPVRCVVPVHLHGRPANIQAIEELTHSQGISLVSDCAQAHGAMVEGRNVATFGDVACFSFYPTKNLGAFGDGGACVTNRDDLSESLRELRQYGFRGDRVAHREGACSRLDELQAAILRVRLKHFSASQSKRQHIASRYLAELRNNRVQMPDNGSNMDQVWHQFVIRTADRSSMLQHLKKNGIGFGIHYPVPIHRMPAYGFLGYAKGSLPETELAADEILSLPIFAGLTDSEVDRIIQVINVWPNDDQIGDGTLAS